MQRPRRGARWTAERDLDDAERAPSARRDRPAGAAARHHRRRPADAAQAQRGNLRIEAADGRPGPRSCRVRARAAGRRRRRGRGRPQRRWPTRAGWSRWCTNLVSNAHKYGRPPYTLRVRAAERPGVRVASTSSTTVRACRRSSATSCSTSSPAPRAPRERHRPRPVRRPHARQAQGGTVGYAPRPGGGAVFTLTLPARPR